MSLLITGASGFIGEALRRMSVLPSGSYLVSRRATLASENGWTALKRTAVLDEDIRLPSVMTVVHLEVKQHVTFPTDADLLEFEQVNVRGTAEWLNWCSRNDVRRFVYFSTIKAVRASEGVAVTEDAPAALESPYGESKWRAEQLVRTWVREDSRRGAVIIRPAVVYGPNSVGNLGEMVRAIRRGRFGLIGRNDNIKSIVSIRNLSAAVAFLIARIEGGKCEVYNLTDREVYTVRDIDRIIRASIGKRGSSPTMPVPIARALAAVGDAAYRITGRQLPLNSQRLRALLEHTHFSCEKLISAGFVHLQSTDDGIREMVIDQDCGSWKS